MITREQIDYEYFAARQYCASSTTALAIALWNHRNDEIQEANDPQVLGLITQMVKTQEKFAEKLVQLHLEVEALKTELHNP